MIERRVLNEPDDNVTDMGTDDPSAKCVPCRSIESENDLHAALEHILRAADANSVDVRGGWVVERSDTEAWNIEITRVVPDR